MSGTRLSLLNTRLKRRLIIAGAAVIAACLLVVIALTMVYPRVGAWYVRSKVVPRLETKLGRKVAIGGVDISLGHAVLRDVTVRGAGDKDAPLVRLDRVDITFDTWQSFVASAKIDRIDVKGGAVSVRRGPDGTSNIDDLKERFAGRKNDTGEAGAKKRGSSLSGLRPRLATASGLTIAVDDEQHEVHGGAGELAGRFEPGRSEMTIDRIEVDAEIGEWLKDAFAIDVAHIEDTLGDSLDPGDAPPPDAPDAAVRAPGTAVAAGPIRVLSATKVTVTDDADGKKVVITGGELTPWKGLALTGVTGTLREENAAGRLAVSLEGGYGGVADKLWTASGWVDPKTNHGEIEVRADRFSLERLRPILEKSSLVDYQKTTVDAALKLTFAGDVTGFVGGFHLHDLTVGHPMLADRPVPDLDVSGDIAGSVDKRTRTLALTRGDFVSRELPFKLTGTVALPGGVTPAGGTRERAAVTARFVIAPLPCQKALEAFPPEMTPYMQGFKLKGTFSTDLTVAIDLSDLPATQLGGSVTLFACRILKSPEELERLEESFEHFVEVERDQWVGFMIGPENPDFVPITEVSPHILNSFMTTEDSAFYKHRGFIAKEFRTALIKNLDAGYFKYGASSITMQTVKNVLLYREKTLSRKLQELFLTYSIEQVLEKDRIFEIYVNAIEFGPGLYGIGPAARHYFGKAPRDITPKEAAFFSSILPSPKARYKQYCQGTLTKWTVSKIDRILGLMLKRGRLTQEEYDAAIMQPLMFVKDGTETEQDCMRRVQKAIKNARPTNPLKK
ncbi:MAG TPA: transglycosylase domain-containing protein [Kofleriaceae bacterium]|nr:transglycosylase domain-containing protein [Kofleriaceae bacterium]